MDRTTVPPTALLRCPPPQMDCSVTVERRKDNQRLLQISMAGKLSGSQVLERSFKWNIE